MMTTALLAAAVFAAATITWIVLGWLRDLFAPHTGRHVPAPATPATEPPPPWWTRFTRHRDPEWDGMDDDGQDIADIFAGTCDWGDCDEIASETRWDDEHGWLPVCIRHGGPRPGPYPHEDVPRPRPETGRRDRAEPERETGPGYFHDDKPAEFIPTERLGDAYVPNLGYDRAELDATLTDLRPEPRAGQPAWRQQRWPKPPQQDRTWVDDLVQAVLEAPNLDVIKPAWLELYVWNWRQRRAIEAA